MGVFCRVCVAPFYTVAVGMYRFTVAVNSVHTMFPAFSRGQIYACAMFRFRRQIDVIFLKFYRDSLLCVVILGISGAIRQPCERFGMEILKNMAMRRIRAASNPAAVAAGHRIACLRALAGVTRRAPPSYQCCAVPCCRSVSNNPAPRAACGSA